VATTSDELNEALGDIEQTMPRFARWMYRSVRKGLGHRVMDAGAGIGTYTELLLADGREVVSLEYDGAFVERLRQRFAADRRVSVQQADLGSPAGLPVFPEVDSALCLNVLEHIEDDVQALQNLRRRVRVGGRLVALVPAYHWLFNTMDKSVGHHRRYGRREFLERLRAGGWTVERSFRFNVFGIPGWYAAGTLLRRSTPGRDLARLFDWLIPFFALSEKYIVRGAAGLSVVAVCRRDS